MDRFAQAVVKPLFLEASTMNEINAVNSGFSLLFRFLMTKNTKKTFKVMHVVVCSYCDMFPIKIIHFLILVLVRKINKVPYM